MSAAGAVKLAVARVGVTQRSVELAGGSLADERDGYRPDARFARAVAAVEARISPHTEPQSRAALLERVATWSTPARWGTRIRAAPTAKQGTGNPKRCWS